MEIVNSIKTQFTQVAVFYTDKDFEILDLKNVFHRLLNEHRK